MLTKILKILFIILFLITGIEIVYYFLINSTPSLNLANFTNKSQEIKQVITIPPDIKESTISSKIAFILNKYTEDDLYSATAMYDDWKIHLKRYEDKFLIQSLRTEVYESTITDLNLTGGKINNYDYLVSLNLEYKGNKDYILYLNKDDTSKTKIYLLDSKGKQTLTSDFNSLKTGDKIRLELSINTYDPLENNVEQIVITKIGNNQ